MATVPSARRTFPYRIALLVLVLAAPAATAQTASFQGLGDLPGNIFFSEAHGVSADGAVIVGTSDGLFDGGMTGDQAFRWTADGMVGLGNTPSTPPGSAGRGR